jgi:hypothetical protein
LALALQIDGLGCKLSIAREIKSEILDGNVRPMPEDKLANPSPQFKTAEYAAKSGTEVCKACNQTISGQYYRVNGVKSCGNCAEQTMRQLPKDSHKAYVRGIMFGVGAAILGLILYAAFGIITGLEIGYISLAVGYLVGKGIKMGSNGLGGRRYQIAAALLTYAAVSIAAIPIGISQYNKGRPASQTNQSPPARTDTGQTPSAGSPGASDKELPPAKPQVGLGAALGYLALLGLASPFLAMQDPLQGGIGLVILFVGIRIAWQMTAGNTVDILGPFNATPTSAQPDGG